ncbi:MAG TPA: DUF2203 domain-containing protein [Gemmatimonadales bacterium]|nr:DUF2203 domain-containing protein [Gemmatimonadales bacterium]
MAMPRIFTVREAEATLPLVRRVVGDLLEAYPRWKELVARYELLTAPLRAESGEPEEIRELREAAAVEAARINDYLTELEEIGCVFKGFDAGLVDFYALMDDRLVFLCWRMGESHISCWHEVDAGFAGRQRIDASMMAETVIE